MSLIGCSGSAVPPLQSGWFAGASPGCTICFLAGPRTLHAESLQEHLVSNLGVERSCPYLENEWSFPTIRLGASGSSFGGCIFTAWRRRSLVIVYDLTKTFRVCFHSGGLWNNEKWDIGKVQIRDFFYSLEERSSKNSLQGCWAMIYVSFNRQTLILESLLAKLS